MPDPSRPRFFRDISSHRHKVPGTSSISNAGGLSTPDPDPQPRGAGRSGRGGVGEASKERGSKEQQKQQRNIMWSAVSQLVAGVWAILTCPGHPPVRFPPLVSPVPAYDARILPVLARDVALASTGFHVVNRIPDYLRRPTAARHELDEALPDDDHTLPNCGVPFDIDLVGQYCGDGGQQQYDQMGFPHPSFYSRMETTTHAADAVCRVPSFRHEDGVTSSDGALEMAVPIAPFDVHTDGVYSFATFFRDFPRASKTDDDTCVALTCHEAGACALATLPTMAPLDLRDIHERVVQAEARQAELRMLRCAALTCDEAGACALATLPTVAPLDLRHIHERVLLAEASRAGLDMLRQTADLQRLFIKWEGTMVCHAIDPDDDDNGDGDDHSDPPTVYTFAWVKRVMSSAGALAHPVLEHVGAYATSVGQRLSAINVSATLSRCFESMAAISPSDFNLPWLSAYDLLVGVLLLDIVVRASEFCWRSLGGGGGERAADGGKAMPPAPSGDDLMTREWVKFRADFAGAEARIKQENRTGLESLHEIFQRCFDEHSRGIQKNLKTKMKRQKADMTRSFAGQMEALERKYAAELEAGLAAERAAAAMARGKAEVSFQQTMAALKARLAREASEGNEQHDLTPQVATPFHDSAHVGGIVGAEEMKQEEGEEEQGGGAEETKGRKKTKTRRGLKQGGRREPQPRTGGQ